MTQYLLSIYQPDGPAPDPEFLEPVMAALTEVNDRIKAAGAWVFSLGLHPPSTATVVRGAGRGEVMMTDGPYLEGKEHIGGIWVIDVPDLDAALRWGTAITAATTLPVEVRPLAGSCG